MINLLVQVLMYCLSSLFATEHLIEIHGIHQLTDSVGNRCMCMWAHSHTGVCIEQLHSLKQSATVMRWQGVKICGICELEGQYGVVQV